MELRIHFFCRPGETLGVLAHFEAGNRNAARVDRLGRRNDEALLHEEEQRFVRGGHVGDLDVVLEAVGEHLLRFLHADLVLVCAGHADVDLLAPGLLAGEELYAELVSIVLNAVAAGRTHFEHVVDLLGGDDTVGIVDVAVRASEGDDLRAELSSLLADAPGHVAEAGDRDRLAFDGVVLMLENFAEIIHSAVTGRFGADQGAAEGLTLTGEHAVLISAADALILAEQVADLTAANADIASGDVHIGANVAIELSHERLAETHDLHVALAVGIEVGTALGTAHGQGGEAVFEGLLEAEELHDRKVHVAGKAQAALVGADGAVELDAVAAVHLNLAGIVDPGHAELDGALGLNKALEQAHLLIFRMLFDDGFKRGENFFNSLNELGFMGVARFDLVKHFLDVSVHGLSSVLMFRE